MRLILRNLVLLFMVGMSAPAWAHGLIEDPPSRNWYCGAITKPDEVVNNAAEYPVCGDAFDTGEFTAGYQFMSVLTHDLGRNAVTPLPETVCGFGSETFNGGATPWDAAIDWPTTTISPGRQEFKWNIQWGPHFDDTEEFRYWITRPDFQFDQGTPLTWDDFEPAAFCILTYDDSRPNDNPDIVPAKETTQFRTFCTVPERQGRHVIYGEWGRNHYTYERFHGCIDVVFDSNPGPILSAVISQPDIEVFSGEGVLTLDGSESTGDNLSYLWGVSAPDGSWYTITAPNQATTTLMLVAPDISQNVSVSLTVSSGDDTASTLINFFHETELASTWVDLGPLTEAAQTLQAGDALSVRTVSGEGIDTLYPPAPLILTANQSAADIWPATLAESVNLSAGSTIAIGQLDDNGQIAPVYHALNNRIYRQANADVVSAFLQIDHAEDPDPETEIDCIVKIRDGANPWWAGMDVATNDETVMLDFSDTGLDLTNNLTIDPGNFAVSISGQTMILTKPNWVTIDLPGYLGFNANNNAALTSFTMPDCVKP